MLWMKQTLSDFGLTFSHVPIKCDNTSALANQRILCNTLEPNTEIRHNFLRDHTQKWDINLEFVRTEDQFEDILTKPLNEEKFVNF